MVCVFWWGDVVDLIFWDLDYVSCGWWSWFFWEFVGVEIVGELVVLWW